jgi:hypothetical protein
MLKAVWNALKSGFTFIRDRLRKLVITYVYLLYETGEGYHKIGITANPRVRFYSITRGTPHRVDLLHLIACEGLQNRKLESELHKRYAAKRIKGEWFQLDPADVEAIRGIKTYGSEVFMDRVDKNHAPKIQERLQKWMMNMQSSTPVAKE